MYFVKEACKEITNNSTNSLNIRGQIACFKIIWEAFAPHNAKVMAWRLVRARLPMKDILWKRRVICNEQKEYNDNCA